MPDQGPVPTLTKRSSYRRAAAEEEKKESNVSFDMSEDSDGGGTADQWSSGASASSGASSSLIRRRQRTMMKRMRRQDSHSSNMSADPSNSAGTSSSSLASSGSSRKGAFGRKKGGRRTKKLNKQQPVLHEHHELLSEDDQDHENRVNRSSGERPEQSPSFEPKQPARGSPSPPPPERKSFLSRRKRTNKKNKSSSKVDMSSSDPKSQKSRGLAARNSPNRVSTLGSNGSSPLVGKEATKKNRRSFFRRRKSNSSLQSGKSGAESDAEYKSEAETEFSTSPTSTSATSPQPEGSPSPQKEQPYSYEVEEDEDEDEEGKDPVVRLFEDRTTQRVRFALVDHNETDRDVSPPRARQRGGGGSEHPEEDDESGSGRHTNSPTSSGRSFSLKRFMKGALFGAGGGDDANANKRERDALDAEVQREIDQVKHEIVWESTETDTGGEIVVTATAAAAKQSSNSSTASNIVTFQEDPNIRKEVIKLLNKARRAQYVHFRYEYAVKCYMKALEILKKAEYPQDHPVALRTFCALNHAHHVVDSYKNSAHIVKMGIKHEDAGEFVRALKMYTIAYRIRVEILGRGHPSLVVLLNLLGNIQIQRGELEEAMQIYELALKDEDDHDPSSSPHMALSADENDTHQSAEEAKASKSTPNRALLARSVTYRDMGIIYEKWGDHRQALDMYHKSLDFLAEYKQIDLKSQPSSPPPHFLRRGSMGQPPISTVTVAEEGDDPILETASSIGMGSETNFPTGQARTTATANATGGDDGMEVLVGRSSEQDDVHHSRRQKSNKNDKSNIVFQASSDYDAFFPPELDEEMRRQRNAEKDKKNRHSRKQHQQNGDYADIDAALTLHQIAQLHRSQGEYNLALSAFTVSLRGMKYCVGRNHPNVAAILGNMGNLQKEMGDMDASFATYQQVLGIESYRLGLSHPDVAVTLHNIATIDAARGNHEHALALYRQVIALQRKLFGPNHVAVAVTCACMGDVYERVGDIHESIGCFEEAVRIKTITMGRHSLEVARLLHKLGKLAISQSDYPLADSYVSRAILIYRLNKLSDLDEWMVDATRDGADIDAAIAMSANLTNQSSFDHYYNGDSDYR
eukprot:CAMPEP_0172450300 /NCGR_PEP_ID=MMETSP1065-20121228/8700_1 /TAXON_ID=265537 /ORGANISM="Amphiprora paludosa, Strain CCMP125" /LENGTH=1087 /DNA_ID=CAMNT_0013202079 /DNA_START=338 /DNA_END=3601 /DNA_ORIENTATION=-